VQVPFSTLQPPCRADAPATLISNIARISRFIQCLPELPRSFDRWPNFANNPRNTYSSPSNSCWVAKPCFISLLKLLHMNQWLHLPYLYLKMMYIYAQKDLRSKDSCFEKKVIWPPSLSLDSSALSTPTSASPYPQPSIHKFS